MQSKKPAPKRNGKIEFLRFVFATTVLCFHVALDALGHNTVLIPGLSPNFTLFPQGKLGVEFFFLLSGYFMAMSIDSAYRRANGNPDCSNLSDDTFNYVSKRVAAILPYHISFCAAALCLGIWQHRHKKLLQYLVNVFPTLFLLNSTGLVRDTGGPITPEWYLSSMFLMFFVLYPLVKRYWRVVPLTICPFAGLLVMGYVTQTIGQFPGNIVNWSGITLTCNLRALGEMCLGVTSYALSKKLSAQEIKSRAGVTAIKLIEVASFVAVICLMCTNLTNSHQLILLLLFVGITISMGRYGVGNESPLLQNRFMCFLGEVSLPVYLCQNVVRGFAKEFLTLGSEKAHFLFVVVATYAVGTAALLLHHAIRDWRRGRAAVTPATR